GRPLNDFAALIPPRRVLQSNEPRHMRGGNHMGAAVELRDHLMPLTSSLGIELITDLARYAENLLSESDVKKIYRFSDEDWDRLGGNDELVEKIEAEKRRRIRDGRSARERAQQLFAQA